MAHKGYHSKFKTMAVLALVFVLCVSVAPIASAAEVRSFANGITATIFTADEIQGQLKSTSGGVSEIRTANGFIELADNADEMVPFEYSYVERALASMHNLDTSVDVTVYILPATPLASGSSFASKDIIYLAPGTSKVHESTVAYITTHEMGHVLTWAFLDNHRARWDAYLNLRGLNLSDNGPTATHANRAREILAEDIRFLFGGNEANVSSSIENHDLVLPSDVIGLQAMLSGFFQDRNAGPVALTSRAFPNPCNPLTTIEMAVPAGSLVEGSQAILRVFDIRGALVKTVAGGNLANSRITIQWNGTDANGGAAASGRYQYVLQVGQLMAKGAVTLVR